MAPELRGRDLSENDAMSVPQLVSAPLTRAAIFLVVTINPGSDNRDGRPIILRRPPRR